jgi:uncharacterized protein YigA (DUF484 family)
MEFKEDKNRITIQSDDQDTRDVELESLRRDRIKNQELERKLNAIMEQLGITNI